MFCYYCMKETAAQGNTCPECGKEYLPKSLPQFLQPGTVLCDRYLVGNVLGAGGFGVTYAGKDQKLDIRIAVKEFFPAAYAVRGTENNPDEVTLTDGPMKASLQKGMKRFLTEARTLAQFNSEAHIVHASDYFEMNGTAYIIMEYVNGETLLKYLKKNGNLSPEQAVKWFTPMLDVLSRVHDAGLIHRDISPDNFIVNHGKLTLIDFGAAQKVIDDKSRLLSQKAGYSPLEQGDSGSVQGSWMDIYAVCATIYRCITGVVPPEASKRVFQDPLKKPSELGIQIPEHIENAIMHGLQVNYKERTQNVRTLIAELSGEVPTEDDDPVTVLIDDPATELMDDPATVLMSSDANAAGLAGIAAASQKPSAESVQKHDNPEKPHRMHPAVPAAIAACAALAVGFGIWHFAKQAKDAENAGALSSIITEESGTADASAAVSEQSAAQPDIAGTYLIRNYITDDYLCYDANTHNIRVQNANTDACVMEILRVDDGDARYIRPVQSDGMVLNPASSAPAEGDSVNLYRLNDDGTQYWKFEGDSECITIRSCYDDKLVLAQDGDSLHLEADNGRTEQCWVLTRYEGKIADESSAADPESSKASTEKTGRDKTETSTAPAGESSRSEDAPAQQQGNSGSSGSARPSRQQTADDSGKADTPAPSQQQQTPKDDPQPQHEDPKPAEVQSDYLFADYGGGCIITGLKNSMNHLEIPERIGDKTVLAIGDSAFAGNGGIESVSMPDSIESIGASAFEDCTSLSSVRFSQNLRTVGNYAFCNTGLYEIELPGSLREICEGAFYSNGFEQIKIPYGVETIGDYAFGQCDMLENIYIPVTVGHIGVNGFKCDPPTPHHVEYGGSSAEWNTKDYSRSAFELDWNDPDIYYNVAPEWAFT